MPWSGSYPEEVYLKVSDLTTVQISLDVIRNYEDQLKIGYEQ